MNVNALKTIYCQRNSIFLWQKKKNDSIHHLTGQNRGLSGLKNIWPVIMTGDLLSVIIFSPGVALGIEPPTSRSAVKQATDWAIILLWFEIYKSWWIHTTIACLSICTSYDISIQYFLKLLRDGWGGGEQGFLSAIISMTLLPSHMYFQAEQKKAQRKVLP